MRPIENAAGGYTVQMGYREKQYTSIVGNNLSISVTNPFKVQSRRVYRRYAFRMPQQYMETGAESSMQLVVGE